MAIVEHTLTSREWRATAGTCAFRLSKPLRFRIWLGLRILALGVWVAGYSPEIVGDDSLPDDPSLLTGDPNGAAADKRDRPNIPDARPIF